MLCLSNFDNTFERFLPLSDPIPLILLLCCMIVIKGMSTVLQKWTIISSYLRETYFEDCVLKSELSTWAWVNCLHWFS